MCALGALAQETRLEAFRLLVKAGPAGLPAGEVARALEAPHNTMSSHLGILTAAGLAASRRDGRSVIYSVELEGTRALRAFLMEDCCGGRPELCTPVLDRVIDECCAPSSKGNRNETSAH